MRWEQQQLQVPWLLNIFSNLEREGCAFCSLEDQARCRPFPGSLLEVFLRLKLPGNLRDEVTLNKSQESFITAALTGTLIGLEATVREDHPNSRASADQRDFITHRTGLMFQNPSALMAAWELDAFFSVRLDSFIEKMLVGLSESELSRLERFMLIYRERKDLQEAFAAPSPVPTPAAICAG